MTNSVWGLTVPDRFHWSRFAGVDLIQEKTKADSEKGGCFVTEVNGNPRTGIIDVTGANHFIDLIQLIERKPGQSAQLVSSTAPP